MHQDIAYMRQITHTCTNPHNKLPSQSISCIKAMACKATPRHCNRRPVRGQGSDCMQDIRPESSARSQATKRLSQVDFHPDSASSLSSIGHRSKLKSRPSTAGGGQISPSTDGISGFRRSARMFTTLPDTPVAQSPRGIVTSSSQHQDNVDTQAREKCRNWVINLPERFSGLDSVLSIPETSPGYGGSTG